MLHSVGLNGSLNQQALSIKTQTLTHPQPALKDSLFEL